MKIKFNNKYDCKLNTSALIKIEEELGYNPLTSLFNDDIPKFTVITCVIYNAMKACEKNLTRDDFCERIDDYLDESGDLMTLSNFVYDLYKASGLVKLPTMEEAEETEEKTEKN